MIKIQKRYYVLAVIAVLVFYILVRDFSAPASFEIIKHSDLPEIVTETETEIEEPEAEVDAKVTENNRVNINTADVSELVTLHGIGEKTAQKIIDYRETHGAFEVIEEIMKINGIGEKKFEAIEDSICVE